MRTSSRTRRRALTGLSAFAFAAVTGLTAGCGPMTGGGGEQGEASCAFVVEFEKHRYRHLDITEFTAGSQIGTAAVPVCDDTGGGRDAVSREEEEQEVYRAYEITGLDTSDAIAVRYAPDDEPSFMARTGEELPPEVRKLLDEQEQRGER
ncbi:DUF6281 family protein [Streptomyces phyllanthi]|uniref:Uncharacterized protein n=1 Tax=Streptomyces phyllanthi TaxID=1803180 RepID=A0A5N8WCY0_9ACTN|nr:DUF6281 family protein [Streptomyces phyllanthi]MPY44005.1 hypothetical protein [Streptomyces phyllanthi]